MTAHVIWSDLNLNIDDWRDDLLEAYPHVSPDDEDTLYRMMIETNNDYLEDERINLNIQLGQPIIVIADLGLWYGRRMGYLKKLVYIRSYHGKRQDYLATEVRKLLVKFPHIIKIVFDHRGLGDAFPQFMSQPWIDPDTKKEYPPIVLDNEKSSIHGAIPLLRACVADNTVNQQIVTTLTISLERGSLELPIASRLIVGNMIRRDSDDDGVGYKLSMQEKAIFVEADALQIEMGNVVSKATPSGSVIYDVAKSTQHKDRYSSLGMAVRYISELEDTRKKKLNQRKENACIGFVIKM